MKAVAPAEATRKVSPSDHVSSASPLRTGAELLFEVFSQRYERGSILVTSNEPFDEWTEIFGSERLTGFAGPPHPPCPYPGPCGGAIDPNQSQKRLEIPKNTA